jgi:hypothetical protein
VRKKVVYLKEGVNRNTFEKVVSHPSKLFEYVEMVGKGEEC